MADEDDYSKFVQPRAEEELHSSELSPLAIGMNVEDGLPMQVAPRKIDKSPPLSPETLICMEDRRSFVVRCPLTGEILHEFAPANVTRLPNGLWVHRIEAGQKAAFLISGKEVSLSEVARLQILHLSNGYFFLVVEPIRPGCSHYLRLQTDLAADRDARYLQRACMAQRGEDGEYYSVRDTMVTACSLRSPRHYESEVQILDAFDASKIAQAEAAREEFSVEAELEREKNSGSGLGVLG